MLRVATIQAEPGMRLALPVHRPLSNEVLLREGYALDCMTIGRLREIRVPEVWIEYPGAERIRRLISPEVLRLQANLAHQTSDLFDRVQRDAGAKLDYAAYRHTIGSLIEELLANHVAAVHLSEIAGAGDSHARHATAVCLLSLLIGLRLQGYLISERPQLHAAHARDTTNLGIGAMLHDVGLARLPPACARCEFEFESDDPEWRSHVQRGYEMVLGSLDASAAIVVLDHHQSWEGQGFPERARFGAASAPRRGHDIHVFARIAAAADAYDRLLHRANGTTWPRVRAMNTLLNSSLRSRFDPVVLAVMPVVAPPYPPGSLVTLSDGQRAFVLDWDPEAPCRPQVMPMGAPTAGSDRGADADAALRETVDLRQRGELAIVEQDGHDVAQDNFDFAFGKALLEARSRAEAFGDAPPRSVGGPFDRAA